MSAKYKLVTRHRVTFAICLFLSLSLLALTLWTAANAGPFPVLLWFGVPYGMVIALPLLIRENW
jgi:hypothetical protein